MGEARESGKRIMAGRLAAAAVFAAGAAAFFLLARFVVRVPGDDISLQEALAEAGLFEHIRYCYGHYSGRVTAKALEYAAAHASVPLWRALETVCYLVLALSLYGILRAFSRAGEAGRPALSVPAAALAACAAPFLMYHRTIDEASLWISGTTNYSFIAVPAVTGGLFFAQHFFEGRAGAGRKAAAALLLAFSLCGNEQTGAVITAFAVIAAASRLIRREKDGYTLALAAGAAALFLLCYVVCPGTKGRFELEMNAHVPDFLTMPFARHADIAARWSAWSLTKGMGFLPGLVWLSEAVLLLSDGTGRGAARTALGVFLLIGAGVHFLAFVFPQLEDFAVGWDRTDYTSLSYAMMAFFALELTACAAAPLLIFSSPREKFFGVLLVLAAYASVLMMTVSPTMIESGERTKYVGSLVMTAVLLRLLARLRAGAVTGGRKVIFAGVWVLAGACAAACWAALYLGIRGGFRAFLP